MRKPHIAKAIIERLEEVQMSHVEVKARLMQIANGSMGTFIGSDGAIDLSSEEARCHIALIRRISIEVSETKTAEDGSGQRITRVSRTSLELHNMLAALCALSKTYAKLEAVMKSAKESETVPANKGASTRDDSLPPSLDESREILAEILGVPAASLPRSLW